MTGRSIRHMSRHRYDSLGKSDPPDEVHPTRDVPEGTARMDDPLFVELMKAYPPSC